ncbi:MAG: hypothetical protein IKK77_01555 [Clostridia bacterium]|nr:hypothetical protein [Clostridia bacterium]
MQNKTLKETMYEFCDIVAEELDKKAFTAVMLPVPTDLLVKADIRPNDKLIIIAEDGKLIIQAACRVECGGDCDECLVAELDCEGDCENCPCRFNCDDSEVD